MKNTFNRFLCFVLIFGIFALCGIFTSCENLFGGKAPINYEKAYIRISTDMKKSVLPSEPFSASSTGLTWTLTGSLNGGAVQELGEWNDENTTTAYNKMISDTSITLNAGTWTFTLTAANESGKLLEATIEQKINGGENTLVFDMKEAVGEGAARGQIDFTLTFPGSVIKNVEATLTSREDENFLAETEFTADQTGVTETFLSEVKFTYSGNDNEALSAGNYILKLELQQQTGTTEATENTPAEPIYEIINTYTCLIHVAPGLCSKGEVTLETLAPLYKVEYVYPEYKDGTVSYKEEVFDGNITTSYNEYMYIDLRDPKQRDGYEFAGWCYDGCLIEEPITISELSPNDRRLVAKWYKNTNGIECSEDVTNNNIDSCTFNISTAEGLLIFRDIVNGGLLENVKIPITNSTNYVYYDVTNVTCNSLNAKLLKDIDLTKDADGNELSWVPINGYSGTFDGGGYTITVNNTYYSKEGVDYQGFFDTLDGATIKNLVVAGEETISESGLDYCGGIASQIKNQRSVNTTFENCVNKRNITVSADVEKLGGFAGYTYSKNSETTNFVNCINLGTIENNYNASEDYDPYVAGFTTGATSYEMCINAGNVTGATFADDEATISGTVAGFDASVSAKFENCINLGDISANSYTFSDEKSCSTEKVYGFSSIDQYNSPTFTNCIDAGSANWPFTGVVGNTTGTYVTSYYNSDSYGSSYNADYAKTSDELCQLTTDDLPNWNIATSRYPLPNIVKSETTEGVSSEIWQEVEAKATLPKGTRGNPFTTWEELAKYVYTSSDSETTVYIAGTLEATGMTYVYRPVTIMATGNATIKRVGNCTNFFQVNKSLKITGTEENNIILDGGDTSTTPLEVDSPLIYVAQTDGSVTLEYCTIQNANCGTNRYGAGLYATSDTSVTIKNCTFRNNTGYDISIEKCNNLTLSGNVEIPKLYFKNEYTTSELTINVDENLTGAVTIVLDEYEKGDLELFNLGDGASLPEGVFTLNNPCYAINLDGTIAGITTTYSDWTTLANAITNASDTTSEFVLKGDITATSTITVSGKITLKAPAGTTITRGLDNSDTAFTGAFFDNQSTLTLEGIILDGGSETSIQAEAPLITSSGSLILNNCTLQNNKNSNATETVTGIFLQINDTSSLCSFNDVSFGENSSDEIPHIKIENDSGEKFTFNLGGSLAGGVPSIDMPSTTCINITESLKIPDGESIKITLDGYTIGNRIISTNAGINLVRENFSLTTTDESWFIDSTGYLAKGDLGVEPSTSETGEYVVSSLDNLLWIARELKTGSITSFNIKLTEDIVIESGKWQFYQLNVSNSSTIDGQGHSITIDEDVSTFGNDAGGLFYKLNNSTVKNLVLKGSITANTSAGGYIGALCRSAYKTTIQNVMSTVEIIDEGSGNAGGLVGYFGGYSNMDEYQPGSFIQNCAVYANITSTNGTVGGLVGGTWSGYQCWQINNCIYAGTVDGGTDQGVGAIIGTHNTGRYSTFKDTWYCANGTSEIVGKYNNDGNGENFNGYDDTVISKNAEEIATEAAATLLNTNSDGTSNVVWKYVEGEAAYPTLKIVN